MVDCNGDRPDVIDQYPLTDAALEAGAEAYFEWERLGGLEYGSPDAFDLARMVFVSIQEAQRKASLPKN